MKRREFLASTAAFGGLLFIPGCATLKGSANDRINMAAIGCGRMGRTNITNLLGVGKDFNAQMVAVCDVDRKRARETGEMIEAKYLEDGYKHKVRIFHDHTELLDDPSIDAVMIAVPDHSHTQIAILAALAGKDIYLEKPITFTVEEGQALVQAVKSQKRVFQAGTMQRSSVYFRKVCEIARNGLLGDLKMIEVYLPQDGGIGNAEPMPVPEHFDYEAWVGNAPFKPYTQDRCHPQEGYSRPGWMQVENTCHGMITNWGSHMLDIAQWGNGTDDSGPVRVRMEGLYEDRGLWNVATSLSAENEYANGTKLVISSQQRGSSIRPGVKFIGSTGWASCFRGSFEASDRELLRWEPGPNDIALYASKNHHRDWLDSIRQRKDPICPVDVAHRTNSICLINMISCKLGRELQWDPKAERFVGDDMANRMLADMRIV